MNQSQNAVPAPRKPRQKKGQAAASKDHLSIGMSVHGKTEAQRIMIRSYLEEYNIVAYGSAGTGKSFVSCYLALKDLFDGKVEKIVVVRSAVQTRDMGFLPGSIDEKSLAYTLPYKAIVNEICQNGTAWDILTKKGMIEFLTTSYIRGTTLNESVVIIDEFANMTWHELNSVVTRIGKNCRLILCGDEKQCDLNLKREDSGFKNLIKVVSEMDDWFEVIKFLPEDIVRSDFVRDWIIVSESQE